MSFIIDRAVGEPVHVKYVIGGLNDRDNRMIKLATPKLLNPELIRDEPMFFKFIQVHENEEYQAVISSK